MYLRIRGSIVIGSIGLKFSSTSKCLLLDQVLIEYYMILMLICIKLILIIIFCYLVRICSHPTLNRDNKYSILLNLMCNWVNEWWICALGNLIQANEDSELLSMLKLKPVLPDLWKLCRQPPKYDILEIFDNNNLDFSYYYCLLSTTINKYIYFAYCL